MIVLNRGRGALGLFGVHEGETRQLELKTGRNNLDDKDPFVVSALNSTFARARIEQGIIVIGTDIGGSTGHQKTIENQKLEIKSLKAEIEEQNKGEATSTLEEIIKKRDTEIKNLKLKLSESKKPKDKDPK